MPGRRRKRALWFAKISRRTADPNQLALLHETFVPNLSSALDPHARITYYSRTWRLSRPEIVESGDERWMWGKLGFERPSRHEQVHYNEEIEDFVTLEAPAAQGNFGHYVVDLSTQAMAFEDRGADLSRQAFLNAMKRFLARGGFDLDWMSDARSFDTWLDSVDVVTRFYVSLREPNPRWSKRANEVRGLVEEVGASRVSIEAVSDRPEGLRVRDTLLDGAADTAAAGNGDFRVSGLAGKGKRFFDSAKKLLSTSVEVTDEDQSRLIASKIRDAMTGILGNQEPDDRG